MLLMVSKIRPARWPQHHEQGNMRDSLTFALVWGDLVNCQGQQKVQIPLFQNVSFVMVTLCRELVENMKEPMKSTCIYRSLKVSQTLW